MTANNITEKLTNKTTDNLNLNNINIPEIPEHIIFPNELNIYLKDQVQYLLYEKGRVQKNLSESEIELDKYKTEVKKLKEQLEQYEKVRPSIPHANLAVTYNTKIVELSKSLREKNCELEKFKTRCSKLEQAILENQKREKESDPDEAVKKISPVTETEDYESKIKYLQDNLSFTRAKLSELRNSNLQLKNELKQANKYLIQEVGDNFEALQKNLTSSNANWRGRAQIICDLQQKNTELKEKLKVYQDKDQGKTEVKKEEYKKVEILQVENQELKKTLEEMKKKIDTLRARNKVYESESIMLKTKLTVSMEQNEKNNQLISNLTKQISELNEKQICKANEKQKFTNNLEKENKNLRLQISKEKCTIEKLEKELQKKNDCIEMLQKGIDIRHNTSYFDSTNSEIRKLEAERIRLVELTEMLNQRLENEKENHFKTQSNYFLERQKAAKLEAKLGRMKTEGYSTNRSYNSCYNSKTSIINEELENQLELAQETIKALETKLNIERQERALHFEKISSIIKDQAVNQLNDWD